MTMKVGRALLLMIAGTLAACGGASDTESYTVKVTGIELAKEGGTETLDVDGLPSANATLIQPRAGRR